tara:strand:+ start:2083 stop:2595 length:513 start_codon:yes stop_codon:yes gene_type:complete
MSEQEFYYCEPDDEHICKMYVCLLEYKDFLDSRLENLKKICFKVPASTGGYWKGSKAYCTKKEIKEEGPHMSNKYIDTGCYFLQDLMNYLNSDKKIVLEVKFLNGMYLTNDLNSTERIQITYDNCRHYIGEGIKEHRRCCISYLCQGTMVKTTHKIMTKSYNKKWVFIKV